MNSRNGNRFLARLGWPRRRDPDGHPAQLRAKLPVERTASVRPTIAGASASAGNKHIGQVLAARRSARRQQNLV